MNKIIKHNAKIPSHSNRKFGRPTFTILHPTAAEAMMEAMVVTDRNIQFTSYSPQGVFTDGGKVRKGKSGSLSIQRAKDENARMSAIATCGNSRNDNAVLYTNPADDRDAKTTFITVNNRRADIQESLYEAAVILEAGNVAMLWTDGREFKVLDLGPEADFDMWR